MLSRSRYLGVFALLAMFSSAFGLDRLESRSIVATFDEKGVVSLALKRKGAVKMSEENVTLQIGGVRIAPTNFEKSRESNRVTYRASTGGYDVEVVYETRPEWAFVTKRIRVVPQKTGRFFVENVNQAAFTFPGNPHVRTAGGASAYLVEPSEGTTQLFVAQQNPFPEATLTNGLRLGYSPKIEWRSEYGVFETDRVCIGAYQKVGKTIALPSVPEWQYVPDPGGAVEKSPQVDLNAYQAIRNCIDAFVLGPRPKDSLKVHIPWCENDYQIDLAKPDGPPQYERIIDQAKRMGQDYVLFTPQNSSVSKRSDSRDAWGWESLLWLGYGPKIRQGEWDVEKSPIHPSVQHFLDYAKKRDVKLLAYVYPTLPWTQNPEWTAWAAKANLPLGGYVGADTGQRGFQDWLVDTIIRFCQRTGVAGVSFDHWWMAYDYPSATSHYAQWYGCRRVLEELRRRKPDILIDGRQQYQQFGAWTWVGGSYPHPTSSDEQPISFRAFPDLHTDRVSADRQRYASYWYTVRNFTPPILNPGFVTHQTQRNGLTGFTTDNFRLKDWDTRGWRYSVLSSIGTAPYNSVVSMIPARDPEEYSALSDTDRGWFVDWMRWPDCNKRFIKKTRPILGQPMIGKVDGTSMIDGDAGYVFLFNPNYRKMPAPLTLSEEIGLDKGTRYSIEQVEPERKPLGIFRRGERIELPLPGTSATVLKIQPSGEPKPLTLLNASGTVSLDNGALQVEGVSGEVGTFEELRIALPKNATLKSATVNGSPVAYTTVEDEARLQVQFGGASFDRTVIPHDLNFSGTTPRGTLRIPDWVKARLAKDRAAWPVTYTEDDLIAPWLGQDRLLLFVQIADANDKMMPTLIIDGRPFPLKKAYNSIYPESGPGTFVGFYADIASLAQNVEHTIEAGLPAGLRPGQFQGIYIDNVERELTSRISPRKSP